jgi:NADH-quinone oxidoreductase subunit C
MGMWGLGWWGFLYLYGMSLIVRVQEELAPQLVEVKQYAGETTFLTSREHFLPLMEVLRHKYGFDYLVDIGVTDHFEEGLRFEVVYNLMHLEARVRLRVKVRIPEEDPRLPTVSHLWPSANWHEREAWDMMGIRFEGHPDLRRMYLPEDFGYHPLRKEFPLLGIPGTLPLPPKDPPKPYL